MPIKCVGIIPAEETVRKGQSLNALVMAINEEDAPASAAVSIYGSTGGPWVSLTEKVCTLGPKEHAHLYLNIPARCFTAEFWDGEAPEELSLYPGLTAPDPRETGVLVFCDTF